MQKINREALKEAIDRIDNHKHGAYDFGTVMQAAAAFLEITDPEFVPSEGMIEATDGIEIYGEEYTTGVTHVADKIFRAMMKELTE